MKIFSKIVSTLILFISLVWFTYVNAWSISDLLDNGTPNINYCQWEDECSIDRGIEVVRENLTWVETEIAFSQYVQNIVIYLIGFISIIAVVYIIYAGFNILVWTWDEEKIKKSKSIIIYVIVWLAVIYLAYSIVAFVFDVFDQTSSTSIWSINEYNIFI